MRSSKKKKTTPKRIAKKRSTRSPQKKPKAKAAPKAVVQKSEGWVALELTPRGESERNIQYLIDLIRKNIADESAEVFVPIYYENEEFFEKNVSLFNGYYFIRHKSDATYHKLKDSKYFVGVVCDPTRKAVQIIPDLQIEQLKDKFNDILLEAANLKVGQTVEILDGLYKNLNAKILKVLKKEKTCILKLTSLKSRNITISAPFMSLRVIDDGDNSSDVVTF